jgi:tRNA (cytidine/uridine-2'-O-)-methyltransferase
MDYGEMVDVAHHDGWSAFLDSHRERGGRLVLFTTRGETELGDFHFRPNDRLLFGRESAGAPDEVHEAADARVRIPIKAGARSLNVAMAAGIALWEALKQTGGLPSSQPTIR